MKVAGLGEEKGADVQFDLTRVVHGLAFDSIVDGEEKSEAAFTNACRVMHCALQYAWLWLVIKPVERALVLSNRDMCSALRHQYGLSPLPTTWHCKCGDRVSAGHFHRCNRVHGPSTFARHESIVSALATTAQVHALLHVATNPQVTYTGRVAEREREANAMHNRQCESESARKRVVPDAVFCGAELSLATDVSVLYGEAPSHMSSNYDSEGLERVTAIRKKMKSAIASREKAKTNLYADSCAQYDWLFKPFVMESHGFMSAGASDVIDKLAEYASDQYMMPAPSFSGYLRRRVAIALQRGNANLDQSAVLASRGAFGAALANGLVTVSTDSFFARARAKASAEAARSSQKASARKKRRTHY